jgi:Holliday junction resolvase-like predicted endonuclease
MTEQAIQNSIVSYLKKQGYLVYKLITVSEAGVPDLIIHKQSHTFYIEVKKKGGRLSPIQKYQIAKLRKTGIDVIITDNLQEIKDYIKEKHE